MIYNVCIADDEILIQKGIITRLRNSGIPVRVTGCAGNGAGAINLYWSFKPDIFFVDINMPGMDGLEFIHRIREEDPYCETEFIVITGYDNYSYMRKAIQNNVTDYLKKPIATDEFNKVVAATAELILKKHEKEYRNLNNAGNIQTVDFVYFDDYIQNNPGQSIYMGGTLIAAYSPNPETLARVDAETQNIFTQNQSTAGKQSNLCIHFKGTDRVHMYYIKTAIVPFEIISKNYTPLIRDTKIFLGYTYHELQKMEFLVEKLDETMNLRFLHPFGIEKNPEKNITLSVDLNILEHVLENGQIMETHEVIKNYLNHVLSDRDTLPELSLLYRQIVFILMNKYIAHQIPVPEYLKNDLMLFALCMYKTVEELENHLYEITAALGRDINRQQQQGELIFRVCEYLKQNYKNDITLNKLADRFYVSPPYLSRRFREKTGITLMQYLEDIRMEKAKEYLDQLRTPVTKVSEQVGYTDSSYFAKVFKKKYRISPTDYRQRGN